MTPDTLERLRRTIDWLSLVLGIVWGGLAIGTFHMPVWLFIVTTAVAAFIIGWIRWGIRDRLSDASDS